MPRLPLYAVGDPHGRWTAINSALIDLEPGIVVLVGDCDLIAPLRRVVAPALSVGHVVRWIPGNHDVEFGQQLLWGDTQEWSLHGRVEEIGGWRLAGLGGVFRGRVWWPKLGTDEDPAPVRRSAADLLKADCRLKNSSLHLETIFPDDVERLARQRADVLFTHEAPSSHVHGFAALDGLSSRLRVEWHVHGHHHRDYIGNTPRGVAVKGLSIAEVWEVPAP